MSLALQAFGLRLQSELALPGAMQGKQNEPPDVVIGMEICSPNVGSKPQPCTQPDVRELGPYRLTPESLVFTMPGVARFRCRRDGAGIAVQATPEASLDDLAAYLQATALPALLWLRGAVPLHAAAAVLAGHSSAVALAGASGLGKSTLLRTLLQHGARAVGDDCLALRPGPGGQPGVSGLPAATQQVSRAPDGKPVRTYAPIAAQQQQASAPLAHLVELCADGPGQPQLQTGAYAFAVLLRNLHRPRVARLLGQDALLLPALASFARTVTVHTWSAQQARHCTPSQLERTLRNLPQRA